MLQAIVPILSANADTEGRTTPDFNVSILTLSDGGSVDNGGEYVVAPGDHIIRIVVSNEGLSLIHI